MTFGEIPLDAAEGAILAHSIALPAGGRLRKGRRLSAADVGTLRAAGLEHVTAAQLDPDDLDEDAAAAALAADLGGEGISVTAPFTGRVNLHAEGAGLVRVDAAGVAAFNAVDEAITLATLPDYARVEPRTMLATVKIIPYGAPGPAVERARAARPLLELHPFRPLRVDLLLTETPGLKPSLLKKGVEAISQRLDRLGLRHGAQEVVPHRTAPLADAVAASDGDLVLILGASATSDRADVAPAAVVAAGGEIERFGMPVDPGNLLFIGTLGGRSVVGLPGCVRSPALNGADWVLERLAAGLPVTSDDITAMGVGGLLKEIPTRPQPRSLQRPDRPQRPRIEALLLAAGASRRMGGRDKLMEPVGGVPLLRHVADTLRRSRVDAVRVALPPDRPARRAALDGTGANLVTVQDARDGMAASLRGALAAISSETDAVLVVLADMPEIAASDIDAILAAYDAEEGREIVRATTADGRPGHPILFGRRFFESLARLEGDVGAREVLREAADFVVEVPTHGNAAVVDLDTPEAWSRWRATREAS